MNLERLGTPIERCLSEAFEISRSIEDKVFVSYASKYKELVIRIRARHRANR
jgi:hypothetical protein